MAHSPKLRCTPTPPRIPGVWIRGEADDQRFWFGPFAVDPADTDDFTAVMDDMQRRADMWARRRNLPIDAAAIYDGHSEIITDSGVIVGWYTL